MKLISHRGNLDGPNPLEENKPEYIQNALDLGYDVEIDVWSIDNNLFLGHDNPQYPIDISFLKDSRLWSHAKNFEALIILYENRDSIHFFVHDSDTHILTSKMFIWTYPNNKLSKYSVCVIPEICRDLSDLKICYGLCSDYVQRYKGMV